MDSLSFLHSSLDWASGPAAGWVAAFAVGILIFRETQFRKRYRQLLQRSPKPSGAEAGKKNPPHHKPDAADEVEEVEATILFSDLAGFTKLSERLSPKEVVVFLNQYFSTVTDIILKHGRVYR